MLKLKDGRKELYQWDVGIVADVTDENINEVHFSNLRYGVSFNVEVKNGTVNIPPEVLQSGADVFCWAFVRQENGGYTKKEQIFNVEKRPRPADYVYEPTEVLTWEALKQDIEKLEKGTIPTMDKVNVWELKAGAYYVNDTVFYATPHPPVYLNSVEMQSAKGLLYVHIDISNNTTRNFYLFANGNIYFGNSTPNALDAADGTGSISSVVAAIRNEITNDSTDGFATKNAVYNFGETIKTELLTDIGNKADKTDLEALKTEIQGNLDEIGDIIGGGDSGTTEVLWSASLSGFTFDEGVELFVAPYTGELPNLESGPYKIEVNGESVDGWVDSQEDPDTLQARMLISAYSQNTGQTPYLLFCFVEGQVISAVEITNIEVKILKTTETIADYSIDIDLEKGDIGINIPTSYGFVEGAFDITFATDDGSVSWTVPNNPSFWDGDYSNMLRFGRNALPSTELINALKNNTPITITISQNDVRKVITDSYVAITDSSSIYYVWGNIGLWAGY